jgi:hypothetical protein
MLTWKQLNAKLDRFLDDSLSASKETYLFPMELRIDAWNWAQAIFSNHTLRERSTLLQIQQDGRTAKIPDDLRYVGMIYDKNGELAPDYRNVYTRRGFQEGGLRMDTLNYNWAYWTWDGLFHFDKPMSISNNLAIAMDYFADWPDVTYDYDANGALYYIQDTIFVPKWAELPLAHLTAATCLMPGSISAAMANEFRIRIDAGSPLDNPREQEARSHAWWYEHLISKIPAQVKVVGGVVQ